MGRNKQRRRSNRRRNQSSWNQRDNTDGLDSSTANGIQLIIHNDLEEDLRQQRLRQKERQREEDEK